MLVAEKNRSQSPETKHVRFSFDETIEFLEKQLRTITSEITKLIDEDPTLKQRHTILKTIPGIGEKVAFDLVVLLPELGSLSRRQIAALVGLPQGLMIAGVIKAIGVQLMEEPVLSQRYSWPLWLLVDQSLH